MKYRFHPHAKSELDEAVTYLKLAQDFLEEVDRAIGWVLAFPEAWQRLSPNIRRCRLKRFPYGIVYKLYPWGILILAVMHLHREPEYWADRR